ncbi:hypothetical protein FSP39_001488 [Pinctada imbricata]|uniref:Transglutaminase-like domain-containing protein n=1 Tax=Pinctada imbricata TaxID=66713 RepID=A0AA89BUK1_PINIB|nr:hypothetical protein FSP39_001488 [Pinctada imbricata]
MGSRNSRQESPDDRYKEANGIVSTPKDDDIPPPKPPRKTKKKILKSADIKRCDKKASKVPWTASVEALTQYLTDGLKSPLEKVRAFYFWITHNIGYDTTPNFHSCGIPTDSATVLRKRKSVCIGYANLFADLCRQSSIPVKTITGYCKGFGHDPDTTFTTAKETDHAWNAVHVGGDWHFIECTWGAGYKDDKGRFIKKFSEFHFLTPPKHFVVSHFPYFNKDMNESTKWQLLRRPLDLDTFSQRLKGTSRMYEFRVKPKSHPNSIIDVCRNVEIKLQYPKSENLFMTARFFSKFGQKLDQFVMIKRLGESQMSVQVRPPRKGDYMLHLYGKTDPEVAELDELMKYVLRCKEAEDSVPPYPQHTGLWGAYSDFEESGLHKSAAKTIEHNVTNGKLRLKLKTVKLVDSIVKLEHSTQRIGDNDSYALLQRDKNYILLSAKFPWTGNYKLSILTKNAGADTFSPRLSYLIHCTKAMSPCCQFPKEFQQTTHFSCRLIEPLDRRLPKIAKCVFDWHLVSLCKLGLRKTQ